MNEDRRPQQESKWKMLKRYAGEQVGRLQTGYLRGTAQSKADLALLRKVDPAQDDRLLLAWEATFQDPPAELMGRGDTPEPTERVLVTALHLFAIHQQSKAEPMHVSGIGLGAAIRQLTNPNDAESRTAPVMRRYHALTTATGLGETTQHLRGLVSQLREKGAPLDYAQLALDLLLLDSERTRSGVRLRWARDLTRAAQNPEEEREKAQNGTG